MNKYRIELATGSVYTVEGYLKPYYADIHSINSNEYHTGETIAIIPTSAFIQKIEYGRNKNSQRQTVGIIPRIRTFLRKRRNA